MKALANLVAKSLRSLLSRFLGRYYNSIHDCPIWHFNQVMTTGDYRFLCKNGYPNIKIGRKKWETIFDQHIKVHGLPENYIQYIKRMIKSLDHHVKSQMLGQKWQVVKARVAEAEAKNMLTGQSESVEAICATLSKLMGFPISPITCTVSEFYSYLKINSKGG